MFTSGMTYLSTVICYIPHHVRNGKLLRLKFRFDVLGFVSSRHCCLLLNRAYFINLYEWSLNELFVALKIL